MLNQTPRDVPAQTVVEMTPTASLPPLSDTSPVNADTPQSNDAEVAQRHHPMPRSIKILLLTITVVAALVIAYLVPPVRGLFIDRDESTAPIVLTPLNGGTEPVTAPPKPDTAQVVTERTSRSTEYPVETASVEKATPAVSSVDSETANAVVMVAGGMKGAETAPVTPVPQSVTETESLAPEEQSFVHGYAQRLSALEDETQSLHDLLQSLQQAYQGVSEAVFRVQSSVDNLEAAKLSEHTAVVRGSAHIQPARQPVLLAIKSLAGQRVATLQSGSTEVRLREGQSANGWRVKHIDMAARYAVVVHNTQEQVLYL